MRRRRIFTLLEALVKEELIPKPGDCVYVGKDSREEVTYIIGVLVMKS